MILVDGEFLSTRFQEDTSEMATKNAKLTLVETPAEETTPVVESAPDLQTLMAQQKAIAAQRKQINEQIKAARDAMPKRDRLAEVLHRQNSIDAYVPRMLANRVKARIAAGQDRETAQREVIQYVSNLVLEILDREEMDEQTARNQEVKEEATND
jgi:hypothetical protein